MNKKAEIIDQAAQILKDRTGMKINWQTYGKAEDMVYGIVFQDRVMQFKVEYKKQLAAYQVSQVAKTQDIRFPLLVVADQIAAPAREQLRMKGIAYVEANGNIFISNSQAIIFLDGNKPIKEAKPVTNRAFTKTGLKAVFHLLNNPDAITRTYRQLAEETGIALGNIKYIMDGLAEAGFILPLNKRKATLKNKRELLDRWIAGYRDTLRPDLFKGSYRFGLAESRDNWQVINVKDMNMEWGGQAAGEMMSNYFKAKALTLYTPEFSGKQANAIGLVPDGNGDVHVFDKFWHEQKDVQSAISPLLVYTDLLITDDPKCIETANLIYAKHIKNQIETDQA